MRVYGSCLAALIALTVSTSCALELDPDDADGDVVVTSQAAEAEDRLLCQFDNRTFDLPAKQCFPAVPRDVRSVVFGLVASDIPEPSRRYTWNVRSIPSKSPQGTDLFTKSGCGQRGAGCTLSIVPREFLQQFLVVLEVVNVDVSPSEVESYSAVASIPAVLPLRACTFNGTSIPSGTSLIATSRATTATAIARLASSAPARNAPEHPPATALWANISHAADLDLEGPPDYLPSPLFASSRRTAVTSLLTVRRSEMRGGGAAPQVGRSGVGRASS